MKFFDKKINIVLFSIMVAMTITVVTLLAIFIPRREDDSLLRACFINDRAVYVDSEDESKQICGEVPVETIVWGEKVPFMVNVTEDPDQERSRKITRYAISGINVGLGFDLLKMCFDEEAPIQVTLGAPVIIDVQKSCPLGEVSHYKRDGKLMASVTIYSNVWDDATLNRVLQHELLHAVGLAHTMNDEESVMYPFTPDSSLFGDMMRFRITDSSKRILHDLYWSEN